MNYRIGEVLLTEEKISRRVREMALEIAEIYRGQDLMVIGILKGAVIFMSDLVRSVSPDVRISMDFMAVSSYGDSTKTSGIVRFGRCTTAVYDFVSRFRLPDFS